MISPQSDRLDRIEALLERSIVVSDERMTRIEQKLQESVEASNDSFNRVEQSIEASNNRLTRIEQSVESSNDRFLESFSQDLRTYTESMNSLASRLDGVIAASNYNRDETNLRLARIDSKVSAIANHLGIR